MAQHFVDMIVTHLNAPYGPVVTGCDVVMALKDGDLHAVVVAHGDDRAASILANLFVECSPSLIGRACHELRLPLTSANKLYLWLVSSDRAHRVKAWEREVKELVC